MRELKKFMYFGLSFLGIVLIAPVCALSKGDNTNQAVIQGARDKALERDRKGAMEDIVKALKKERRGSSSYNELQKNLDDIGEMFFTDKALQLFEAGRAVLFSAPIQTIEKSKEALALEPDHQLVQKNMALAQLYLGEAAKALAIAETMEQSNPLSRSVLALKLQSLVLLKKQEEFVALLKVYETQSTSDPVIELARAKISCLDDKWRPALTFAERAKALDPNFPEPYLWIAKIKQKLEEPYQPALKRYVEICQKVNEAQQRKYEMEPSLCKEKATAEKQLETLNLNPTEKKETP